MREFCIVSFGIFGIVLGRWAFGLEWTGAAFLYFPMAGLATGILNNEGERICKHVATMLLLPAALSALPQLVQRLVLSVNPGLSNDRIGMVVLSALAAAVLWLAFSGLCSLVTRMVGPWALPSGAHDVVCKVLSAVSCAMAFVGVVIVLRVADAHLLHLSPAFKTLAVVALAVLFVLSMRRMLDARVPLARPVSSGKGVEVASLRLVDKPKTTFGDVAGMQEVKDQIRLRLIEPVRNAARAKQYGLKVGGGMLLYGPPGTGKTLLARAVAGELDLPFYTITAADVFGKYVGESERNIRKIFADIRKNRLSVVFIDELETLFPSRSNDVHESTRKVISVLLQELDGIDQGKNPILLIGATNVPWLVDEAFMRPGRFDVKTFVGLPDVDARRGMLIKAFAKGTIPHEPGLTAYMASATSNYSGADLNGVMNRLRQMAYDRRATCYTRQLADEAIALSSPTANGETMDRIRDWEAENLPVNSSNSGSAGMRLAVTPTTTLDDVAGMEDVKEQIRLRLVEPVQHHTLANLYGLKAGGGMLLYGPPGTGKTFLARAVAGELKLPFYTITAADVFGKFVGESERNVRRIFRDIRKNDLSVVFIDELESIFPKRTSGTEESTRKVISVLLQELDGLDQNKNPILLIGATNVPWMVDEAFLRPGRFDTRAFVGLPDVAARRQMFINALYACKLPHEDGLTGFLAGRTDGFTGADINGVLDRMKQLAYMRRLKTFDYFLAEEVLQVSKPTACGEILEQIHAWEDGRK